MSKTTYKSAGVDIDEGNRFVELIKPLVKSTHNKNLHGSLGGFSGAFSLDLEGISNPLLVSSTDGVGTKLKIAFLAERFDTIGIDLVAMCVNDIITCGARPLFFLDYFATSKLDADRGAEIVKGIAAGCVEAGCVLTGGETAEMPGFYSENEFDLAGFSVGLVDRDKYIDGSKTRAGDKLIGLPSSGLHSNGYSLVRKVLLDEGGFGISDIPEGFEKTLGDELLTPTRIYVNTIIDLAEIFDVRAVSHITGGGLVENVPRVIPDGFCAVIDTALWKMPAVFELVMNTGDIEKKEMYRTFNCGIGMVICVSEDEASRALNHLNSAGEKAFVIGEIKERPNSSEKTELV